MAVKIDIFPEKDLTVITITGAVSVREMIDSAIKVNTEHVTKRRLWDWREGSFEHFSDHQARHIAERLQSVIVAHSDPKIATVVSEDKAESLAKTAHVFREIFRIPATARTFRSYDDAIAWLMSD